MPTCLHYPSALIAIYLSHYTMSSTVGFVTSFGTCWLSYTKRPCAQLPRTGNTQRAIRLSRPIRSCQNLCPDRDLSTTDYVPLVFFQRTSHLKHFISQRYRNKMEPHTNKGSCRRGIRRWQNELAEEQLVQGAMTNTAGSVGLLPVAWLLARRRVDFDDENCRDVVSRMSHQGAGRFGFAQVILPTIDRWLQQHARLIDIVAELVHFTVEQHLRVAWSRLATDVREHVALLVADGDRWHYRKSFSNGRLGSRIRQTVGWLRRLEAVRR